MRPSEDGVGAVVDAALAEIRGEAPAPELREFVEDTQALRDVLAQAPNSPASLRRMPTPEQRAQLDNPRARAHLLGAAQGVAALTVDTRGRRCATSAGSRRCVLKPELRGCPLTFVNQIRVPKRANCWRLGQQFSIIGCVVRVICTVNLDCQRRR